MADTWMLPKRKKEILSYIEEGAGLEDLIAAGYTDKEIQEINAESEVLPFQETGDTLQSYTPTRRENFSRNVQEGLKTLGLPEGVARRTAEGVAGTSSNTGNMGLADFSPLGILFGVEEGVDQAKRGYTSGDKSDMAMGVINTALNVASAIPGVKATAKGIQKLAEKSVDVYDPTVLRMFFGENSPNADWSALDRAVEMQEKGRSEEDIWLSTGWWKGPNGWRFEISDDKVELSPSLQSEFATTKPGNSEIVNYLRNQVLHKEFYDSLPITPKAKEFLSNSSLTVTKGDISGKFYSRSGDIDASALTEKDLKDVVLHEMQHLEQELSSANSKGSSPEFIATRLTNTFSQLPREAKEYLAERKKLDTDINFVLQKREIARSRGMADTYLDEYTDVITEFKRQRLRLKQDFKRQTSPEFQTSLEEFHNLVGGFSADLEKNSQGFYIPRDTLSKGSDFRSLAYDLYERNAGEVEARLTSARKDLTPSERALRVPSKDLDVPLNKALDNYDVDILLNNMLSTWDNIKTKKNFAQGGVVENSAIDPVSKNPVPPGATPKEVRDDVPIMASEGEYVIPANVVRFLGLDKIEKMVSQAKEKLKELDAQGRIGGQGEDDLPFSAEELQTQEDQPVAQMATGGMIQDPSSDIDPETGLPWWMLNRQQRSPYESKPGETNYSPPTGMAASVDKWSTEDLMKYGDARNSVGQGVGQMFASLVPFGGLAAKAREKYLEKAVPERIKNMLSTGKDEQGKALTPEQLSGLRASYEKTQQPMSRTGIAKVVRGIGEETGIIKPRDPNKKSEAPGKKSTTNSSKKTKEDRR